MRSVLIYFSLFFLTITSTAQTRYYSSPVKIPLLLSGSFAELRNDHFHSGIDIKTGGATGVPVYSTADGYISRIVVSPTGFGKAVYIDHPNGTTSVYGHLNDFREDIQRYVKNIQYRNKSFRIDLQVPQYLFPVKKDNLIGYSGNTGSSGGPHLHFEIRDSRSQIPLNPLKFNFPVKDNTPPKIFSLMIIPLEGNSHIEYEVGPKSYPVIYSGNRYMLNRSYLTAYGSIGFAIQTNDYFDGSNNRCGVYSIDVKIDGELYYSLRMDRFSFGETRYINSHINYEEFIRSRRRYHKTWLDPGNGLSIYNYLRNNGIFKVTDGNVHSVSIEVKDIHGNKSDLNFTLTGQSIKIDRNQKEFNKLFRYDQSGRFHSDSIRIEFPRNTLYNDLKFTYRKIPSNEKLLSAIHIVHNKTVPLHSSVKLSIQAKDMDKTLHAKALLVDVDTITGNLSAAGGSYINGWVTGNIRAFGNYAVTVDTIPPKIIPLNIEKNSVLTGISQISFRITDELSGIKSIDGTLDGKWVLFEYDPKNNLIVHYFDPERFEMDKQHYLKLTVTDSMNNKSFYETTFRK